MPPRVSCHNPGDLDLVDGIKPAVAYESQLQGIVRESARKYPPSDCAAPGILLKMCWAAGVSPSAAAMRGLMLKMSGMSRTSVLSFPSVSHRRRAAFAGARTLAIALATVMLASEAAWADCTPASANNVTATCTRTTTTQRRRAPGTSAGTNGYGPTTHTGLNLNVDNNASVIGT